MKNILSILFVLLFGILSVKAQSHKIFINNYGAKVDSINANYYMVVERISDTDWLAKQYLMNDTIKCLGTYKDQNLTIPNGKFTYYYKSNSLGVNSNRADTLNYVQTTGYFNNGLKVGIWTSYFRNGNIEFINNYKNDKLNGSYESYNYDSNTILIKGEYTDGKRNGEWDTFNKHGDIIETDVIKDDKLISSHSITISYLGAKPPYALYDYLYENLKGFITGDFGGKVSVLFSITAEGKVEKPVIIGAGLGNEFDKKLLSIIVNSAPWKPAYNKTAKRYVESELELNIIIKYGKMIVYYIQNDENAGKLYQLTH